MKIIRISPLFVFLLCVSVYLGWGRVAAYGILAAMCHEAGHLTAILLCRKKITGVSVGVCGATIETGSMSYRQEIVCAIMGPVVNFLLCCLCIREYALFGMLNFVLFLYNILPLYPLDGGRALRAALLMKLPEERVRRIVHMTGMVITFALMAGTACLVGHFQCGLWPLFIAAMVLWKTGMAAAQDGY